MTPSPKEPCLRLTGKHRRTYYDTSLRRTGSFLLGYQDRLLLRSLPLLGMLLLKSTKMCLKVTKFLKGHDCKNRSIVSSEKTKTKQNKREIIDIFVNIFKSNLTRLTVPIRSINMIFNM